MAKKGGKNHIKSLNAPKFYMAHKKETKYVAKPSPGRHTLESSIPVSAFLKMAGLARFNYEVSAIMAEGIEVNGKRVSDSKYPIGINDVVGTKSANKYYRIGLDRLGHATYKEIDAKEASERVCKIVKKYIAPKGRIMVTLNDSTNIPAPKGAKVGDSVMLSGNKAELISFREGGKCFIMDGVHAGTTGTIKSINMKDKQIKSVTVESEGSELETLAKNIMVVG
ncbi:MAG: hypothetical protein QXN59_01850 [Candidatus Micrarchaeaceae archaeon]